MPRSIARVVRRGDTFYFRMAVPRQWAARLGKRELKVSLRTCNPIDARLRGRVLSNAMDVLFDGLPRMPSVSPQVINQRIRVCFQELLNKSLEWSYLLPNDPACDLDREVELLRVRVEQLRTQLTSQTFSPLVRDEAEELLAASGQSDPDFDARQHACNAIVRAKMEDARILAARLSGDYAATIPADPLFANMEPTGLPPLPGDEPARVQGEPTFGMVAKEFFAFKAKHDWAPKTAADVKRVRACTRNMAAAPR